MSGPRRLLGALARLDRAAARERNAVQGELGRAAAGALPYAGLVSTSLTLAGIDLDNLLPRSLNLLIGEVREDRMFAGIHTALTVAAGISARLVIPLRVVMLDSTSLKNGATLAQQYIAREFGNSGVAVIAREAIPSSRFGTSDLWLATHSKAAHAAQVACAAGLIDRDRVSYLIQDYEPGFSAWSTESVAAAATYHAGFLPVVNSLPLAKYLSQTEGIEIAADLVFAPAFDEERLRRAAAGRRHGPTTVLFYGRPSKPRNLYALGVAALKLATDNLGKDAAEVRFFSAGEPHGDVSLGGGATLKSVGRLSWDDYFDFLGRTDVMLGLQASPHPSHPPLDAAISGAAAVTNDFAGTRTKLHPRLTAVPADVSSLAAAVVDAIRNPAADRSYRAASATALGRPLDAVNDVLAARFDRA